MHEVDPATNIQVIATLLVALIFSRRVRFSKKAARAVGWNVTWAQPIGGYLGLAAIGIWAWPDAPDWLVASSGVVGLLALVYALGVTLVGWAGDSNKITGDPYANPRRFRKPKPSPETDAD